MARACGDQGLKGEIVDPKDDGPPPQPVLRVAPVSSSPPACAHCHAALLQAGRNETAADASCALFISKNSHAIAIVVIVDVIPAILSAHKLICHDHDPPPVGAGFGVFNAADASSAAESDRCV